MDDDIKLSKWFTIGEMKCKHCGICNVSQDLLDKIDTLRDILDRPVIIVSGCRCRDWNKTVGGAPNSYHITSKTKPCQAVDIHAPTGPEKYQVMDALFQLRFTGIAYTDSYVHGDIGHKTGECWTYPKR